MAVMLSVLYIMKVSAHCGGGQISGYLSRGGMGVVRNMFLLPTGIDFSDVGLFGFELCTRYSYKSMTKVRAW
jgi:hypothetical protein